VTPVDILSPAQVEIADATTYYEERSPDAALGFLAALDNAVDLLAENPYLGHPTRFGARTLTLQDYPFDLVYRLHQGRVVIDAVAHHRREPWYWADRMQ
jgi:toxin ParE1/3/4